MCGIALSGCPYIVEVLPDPSSVEDSKGEFVEIRLDSGALLKDTLFLLFENKTVLRWMAKQGTQRLLVHRDTTLCPAVSGLACQPLTGSALPNSRESFWNLTWGACSDSVVIPVPEAGFSYQRSGSGPGDWVVAEPTPGVANPKYENDIRDCAVSSSHWEYKETRWTALLSLSGCDSVDVTLEEKSLDDPYQENSWVLSLYDSVRFVSKITARNLWLFIRVPEDDYPNNDYQDTLLIAPSASPLFLTEIHPCPEEPVPEWVEIYNGSARTLPLSRVRFCDRGSIDASVSDSLKPKETLVLTKDTVTFREWLGFNDTRLIRANLGFLKNGADTILLCWGETRLDSVAWGKAAKFIPDCPAGFVPGLYREENSPGFQTSGSLNRTSPSEISFEVKWSARVCSRKAKHTPLMVAVTSDSVVQVELLSGNGILLWKTNLFPDTAGNTWVEVPLISKGTLGPNYVRFSEGRHEKILGVILRP